MARVDSPDRDRPVPGPLLVATLAVTALVGIALRVWILAPPLGTADSDEAVVGLMARHILDGDIATFFWDQFHGGAIEPALAAAVFAVTGSSVLASKLVPVALAVVASMLVWAIGRRTIGENGARIAAVLSWAAPAVSVWSSTKEYGFYAIVTVAGLTTVLMAFASASARRGEMRRFSESPAAGDGMPVRRSSTWSSRVWRGWGWWSSGNAAPTCCGSRRWRPSAPWSGRLRGWWATCAATGHRSSRSRLLPRPTPTAIVRYRDRNVVVLALIAVAYPFLVAIPATSWFMVVPRYLLYLWPILALLVARAVSSMKERRRVVSILASWPCGCSG